MKIREQIKDWKNIHAERVTVEKKKKKKRQKKRKKNQKMWSEKEKQMKKKKKNDGQYEHFLFLFQWLLSLGLTHAFCCIILLKLYCWRFCCSVRHRGERHNSLRK